MKADRSCGAAVFHKQIGYVYLAHPPHVEPVHFPCQFPAQIRAAGPQRNGKVGLHVGEAALGNGDVISLGILAEGMPQRFIITETIGGLAQYFLHEILLHKSVVVVDKLLQHGIKIVVRHTRDHVAAAHAAESAPVTRSLVYNQHIAYMVARFLRGPHPGKAAAHNQHIGAQGPGGHVHDLFSSLSAAACMVSRRTVSSVRGSLSLKG